MRRGARRRRHRWYGLEDLEPRQLLASGLDGFAQIQGVLNGGAEVSVLNVQRGMFGGRTGRVLVEVDLHESGGGEGATLRGVSRQVRDRNAGSAVLRRLSSDRVMVGMRPGQFAVQVAPDAAAAPLFYTLDVSLVGDVNDDFRVDREDLRRVRTLRGARDGDPRYDEAADVTGDGHIDARDFHWTRANLGASTTIRPLSHQVDIALESDPDGDRQVVAPLVRVLGNTRPGLNVSADLGADGATDLTAVADARGRYELTVPLALGANPVRLVATDAFGQRALRLLNIHRLGDTPQAGLILQSPGPLQGYQEFDGTARRTTTVTNDVTKETYVVEAWTFAVPGSNPLDPNTPNINYPYTVNGSATFNQPAQSSDWWTNLMFRHDPSTQTNPLPPNQQVNFDYANAPMYTEPAIVQLLDGGRAKGVSIFNPTRTFVTTTPDAANTMRFPTLTGTNYNPGVTVQVDGIQPVNQDGVNPTVLNARVNHYSDWGVQIQYGNATDTVKVDMLSGSPFFYFTKTGPSPLRFAAEGTRPQGSTDPSISTFDTGDPNVVGLRITTVVTSSVDGTVTAPQVAYYLVMAQTATPGATWNLVDSDQGATYAIYENAMQDGLVVVAVLPAQVNGTDFDQLTAAQKRAIAGYFKTYALNVPTDTALSDPRQSYNPATSTVTSTLSVTTANNGPTLQVLLPHQWRNLIAADQANLGQNVPDFAVDGAPVEMTYVSPRGTSKLYLGNSFTTQLTYRGILPYLPPSALADPATADAIFQSLASWFQTRYGVPIDYTTAPGPDAFVQPDSSTYDPSLTRYTETIRLADQLAAPSSVLDAHSKTLAARLRDLLLDSLKAQLMTWFDISTGKLFHLNTTYSSVIGYPAGFGSDYQLNDHHFHYGYILGAFAAIAPFDPDFVRTYKSALDPIVRDVANFDRTKTDLPFLREFSPWAGHSWADGLGRGGNNQESSSEAMNFAASLTLLGEAVDDPDWRNVGAFLYTTEAESIHQYWFNSDAWTSGTFDPNQSNWPAGFAQLQSGLVDGVTQVANVAQQNISESLFFGAKIDGRYAINWLPLLSQSLYLATNPGYLTANWKQFVRDYTANNVNGQGSFELVVAAYQALVPPDGTTGVNAPGPDGALARLAAYSGVDDNYSGLSKPIVLAWVHAVKALGQYDPTVTADTPHAAVFRNAAGQRTFLVYVPDSPVTPTTSVTFRDAQGSVVATRPVSGPGLHSFAGDSTTPSVNTIQPAQPIASPLFLRSDSNGGNLALSFDAGTTAPNTSAVYPAPTLAPYQQPGQFTTFVTIPARDVATDGNSVDPPKSLQNILTFDSGPITGKFNPQINGGETLFELWLNQYLEPGILWNLKAANHLLVMRVYYNPTGGPDNRPGDPGAGVADRIEEYRFAIGQTNRYNALNQDHGAPAQVFPLTNIPFPQTLNRLRIEIWSGTFDANAAEWSNHPVALSVNTPSGVGRASRIGVPYEFGG